MGETRVDLLHRLEDLPDAYGGATEETILTEMALAALAVEPAGEHAFVPAFLQPWGGALERRRPRGRR